MPSADRPGPCRRHAPRARSLGLAIAVLALLAPSSRGAAADRSKFDELAALMEKAVAQEVDVFAPKTWAKAHERTEAARKLLERNRKQPEVDRAVAEARELADTAVKAAEVGKLSLQQYLDPRTRALAAKGPALAGALYQQAEQKFLEATAKVESGDVKGGLKKAAEAAPLFDAAEDAAIRVDILGAADKLIEKAVADDAPKFALSTLDAARAARARAADVLTKDRYNRTAAVKEAGRAEYEARHASNIALSVRSLNRNDQAWEKLMLLYEIQMNRLGGKMGVEYLPFDQGPIAATDSVLAFMAALESDAARARDEKATTSAQLTGQMTQLRGSVTQQLQQVLARLSATTAETDPLKLAEAVDARVAALLEEKGSLSERAKAAELQLAELATEHQETAAELDSRLERERRFDQVKQSLNPSEGEILQNATGDVVLRLRGLSFDVGKSDIKDEHVPLIEKVAGILKLYPDATYVVEGHTDASGEGAANQQLSERRAFALMQALRQNLSIPADRIKAIGYGSEKPIATNQTPEGRAANRRIDVLILQ
jgi:outer membrane protein OmpA-like peptidoglycan-associated protein